jgi:ATP-dependent Clp protease adaptor protein ClpS
MSSRSTSVFPEVEDETRDQVQPLYHVILLNDEDHTYDYVIEMLVKIFGMTESKALGHAVEVDTGRDHHSSDVRTGESRTQA